MIPEIDPITQYAPALRGPVLMNQDWRDLTYVHWAVDPERIAPLMPPGVVPDVHDGATYVGLVPFRMANAGPGRRLRAPYLGDFLETNLRLYSVDQQGRRGVVFLTLDCERLVVTVAARVAFGVRYRWARMTHDVQAGASGPVHRYRSRVRGASARATLDLAVEVGPPIRPSALDHFLSARWGLHTSLAGSTRYIPNEHEPWPLHAARLHHLDGTLLADAGFGDLSGREPDHIAFSLGVHTRFGLPAPARHTAIGRMR